MRGINKVILIGHLGADPEVRPFNNGGSVTRINIATSEQWTDKQTGEKKEHTEWHRVSLFNRLGEVAAQYLRKGSPVYIEGTLRTNRYTDQNGIERFSTEIRADNMQMLGSNPNNGAYQQPNYPQNQNGQWGNQGMMNHQPPHFNQNPPPYTQNSSNFNQQPPMQNHNMEYTPPLQNFSQTQLQQQNSHLAVNQNPMANNSFVNQNQEHHNPSTTPNQNANFNPPKAGAVDDDIPF